MDAIKEKEEALSKVSQDLFAAMYADAAKQQQAGAGGPGGPGFEGAPDGEEDEGPETRGSGKAKKKKSVDDENVVDVDYEDVDE